MSEISKTIGTQQEIQKKTINLWDKPFKRLLEPESIDEIIRVLESGKINAIDRNKKINRVDQKKFEMFYEYIIIHSEINENIHKFILNNGDKYLLMIINVNRKPINKSLEVFTEDVDRFKFYINYYTFSNEKLELTAAEINPSLNDYIKGNNKDILENKEKKSQIDTKRKAVENIFDEELDELYKQRITRIQLNKNLYNQLKEINKNYYEGSRKDEVEYKEEYKRILERIKNIKEEILEISDIIELSERRLTLYKSGVFITYPFSGLEVKGIDKEIADSYLEKPAISGVTKKGTKAVSKKQGGNIYDLEYLEIPETFSRSIESNFGKIKRDIKKKSKKTEKSKLLKQYNF